MFCGLFPLAPVVLAIFGRYPPLTLPAALILVPLALGFSLRAEFCRGLKEGHIRFKPVQITPLERRSYAPVMVPFALAALTLSFLSGVFPGPAGGSAADLLPAWAGWKGPLELNAERYREHAAFQQAFSYTSLGGGESFYLRYALAGDGLIGGDGSLETTFVESEEIPPFPLASLMDFLANYAYSGYDPILPQGESPLCPLIVLGLCVPLILRDRRRRRIWGKLSMYMDKRIAA
jgi:hypothetical protein